MRRERTLASSPGSAAIGWISTADAIFLGLIIILGISLALHADNTRLRGVTREVKELTDEISRLLDQVRELLEEKAELAARSAEQVAKIARLSAFVASLNVSNEGLDKQLADARKNVDTLTRLIQELKNRMKELSDRVARLTEEVNDLNRKLAALEKENAELKKENADLRAKLARAHGEIERLQKELEAAHEEIARLRGVIARLEREVKELKDELAKLRNQIHKDLVGLSGPLRRVAIVFDASGSMKSKSVQAMTDEDRWQQVQKITATWLERLQFDECVLLVFSNDVQVFPADGTLVPVNGPDEVDNEANRKRLLAYLKSVTPGGWTNTLAAMQRTYQYKNIDTIILFSDGAPGWADKFNSEMAEEVYRLCRRHQDIPVNCIGLGDYFSKELSTFLFTIARETGGTFMGR